MSTFHPFTALKGLFRRTATDGPGRKGLPPTAIVNQFPRVMALQIVALVFAGSTHAETVTMSWSRVGNAGNAADATGYGAVGYEFNIGTYEVTNAQYVAFLNAAARTNEYSNYLYSEVGHGGNHAEGGILRSGANGSYQYAVKSANYANRPVNNVTFEMAARMANWMTNGQGTGSTDYGSYAFSGNTITAVTRNMALANQVFLPTENEWYKAAYHQPSALGGDSDGYWLYATGSNVTPTKINANYTAVFNAGPNTVAYDYGGLAGTDAGVKSSNVGSAGGRSYYGAYDMSGNVWEWTETFVSGGSQGYVRRGGSMISNAGEISSATRTSFYHYTGSQVGFRFASPVPVPEPSTYAMIFTGLACGGWIAWRRSRIARSMALPQRTSGR